jgi:hypothetical protein
MADLFKMRPPTRLRIGAWSKKETTPMRAILLPLLVSAPPRRRLRPARQFVRPHCPYGQPP